MTLSTPLLVPAGVLVITDTWEPLYMEDLGPPAGWHHTLRTAHLNGVMIWREPATRDLLDAAAYAIDGELSAGRAGRLRRTIPG